VVSVADPYGRNLGFLLRGYANLHLRTLKGRYPLVPKCMLLRSKGKGKGDTESYTILNDSAISDA
jgi:hypothetical protein